MATAVTTYSLDQISQYLWTVSNAQSNSLSNGANSMNNGRDIVLMIEGAALNYGIEQNLSGLQGVTNDVYRLCGSKLQQANEILATGSGGVVPTPSGTGSYEPYPLYIPITGSGFAGLTFYQSDDLIGLTGLTTLSIINTVFQLNVSFTFNTMTGTINFDLSGTTGNVYTLQNGDIITANGTYKIVTS